MDKYDFSGWATRNDLKCSDGRTIRKDAFKHNDGKTVPLVWNHQHGESYNVLGHALLENREEGVYAYCSFNETEQGKNAKLLVEHGDIKALSIFANKLQQKNSDVLHGEIREVSLVLAGANPGAFIDSVIRHGETSEEEAVIYTGEELELSHADEQAADNNESASKEETKETSEEKTEKKAEDEETLEDVVNGLTPKQKNVFYNLLGKAIENEEADKEETKEETKEESKEKTEETEGGTDEMKHNCFDKETKETTLKHSAEDVQAVFNDVKRYGSLRDAALAHGIDDIEFLFPEDRNLNTPPEFIQRDMGWVKKVMGGVHHTPFSRIKSMFADITEDDARARGYIKGNLKKDEVFGLLKRSTTPTTIYKKQKLDRDDVIDITDFDVVAWIKGEMRMMLDEEIARAILVGDGRSTSSDDKINEQNIRPIWTDDALYTVKAAIQVSANATDDQKAKAFIRGTVKNRKFYKGSGQPVLYTTEDMVTDCLLMEDNNGRVIYDTIDKLKNALRVSDIVTVPVMEGLTRTDAAGNTYALLGIIVNLRDYNVGADKGGAVNMFDDFDIDYNAQKYLIETRCSGALTKPYSAIAIELKTPASVVPEEGTDNT